MARSVEDKVEVLEDGMEALALEVERGKQYQQLVTKPFMDVTAQRFDLGTKRFEAIEALLALKADEKEVAGLKSQKDMLTWIWRTLVTLGGILLGVKQLGWI